MCLLNTCISGFACLAYVWQAKNSCKACWLLVCEPLLLSYVLLMHLSSIKYTANDKDMYGNNHIVLVLTWIARGEYLANNMRGIITGFYLNGYR